MSLSLANTDGSRRHTSKNKLKELLLKDIIKLREEEISSKDAIVVDIIALLNTFCQRFPCYENLVERLMKKIPKGYKRISTVIENVQ